jgi:Uma2 family endonuclease
VRDVWIVDLTHDVIEVSRQPSPSGYGSTQRVERGGTVALLAFPDVTLAVTEILPARD